MFEFSTFCSFIHKILIFQTFLYKMVLRTQILCKRLFFLTKFIINLEYLDYKFTSFKNSWNIPKKTDYSRQK